MQLTITFKTKQKNDIFHGGARICPFLLANENVDLWLQALIFASTNDSYRGYFVFLLINELFGT